MKRPGETSAEYTERLHKEYEESQNFEKYGYSFNTGDVVKVLEAFNSVLPGDLVTDFDERILQFFPNELLDESQYSLKFYLEQKRFPTVKEELDESGSFKYKYDWSVRKQFEIWRDRKQDHLKRQEEKEKMKIDEIKNRIQQVLPNYSGPTELDPEGDHIVHGHDLMAKSVAELRHFLKNDRFPKKR